MGGESQRGKHSKQHECERDAHVPAGLSAGQWSAVTLLVRERARARRAQGKIPSSCTRPATVSRVKLPSGRFPRELGFGLVGAAGVITGAGMLVLWVPTLSLPSGDLRP